MHGFRLAALDEVRDPAVAAEKLLQFLVTDARENRRAGDFRSVEMQDRQYRPVHSGVEELVGLPARGQRSGLCLPVPDDTGNYQVRVVERRPEGVRQAVAELAPFVNGTGRFRGDVAGDAAGK